VWKELDLLVGDGLGEALDATMFFGSERLVGELLEAGDERATKAAQAISVGLDGGVFDLVEVAADFFRSMDAMVEIGDEAGDCPLEVDVVLPKGVICVDEQSLIGRMAESLVRGWVCGLFRIGHEVDYKGRLLRRCDEDATLGGCLPRLGCDRL